VRGERRITHSEACASRYRIGSKRSLVLNRLLCQLRSIKRAAAEEDARVSLSTSSCGELRSLKPLVEEQSNDVPRNSRQWNDP